MLRTGWLHLLRAEYFHSHIIKVDFGDSQYRLRETAQFVTLLRREQDYVSMLDPPAANEDADEVWFKSLFIRLATAFAVLKTAAVSA